ncbi:manganese-dependent inorganic pyrophosphatase [Natranaerovirga pectinivora]|uniref:inorganic diphosphatase n=1 Tax=Natranaerovirga pectinivora TaxID=682400 RepID=A0A4R3MNV8_9FIRM|nr:putative manganese-dependent inorganic diphosphatase [Natranaerovirga pectinivora]TCT14369.1 manganese-dependent inorganic pyrophosphatase [Natranaerovirga pectinivora]
MDEKIYVFGHRNPDTDSVCSAIAYANLKKQLGYTNITPFALGGINNETKFALDYFNFKAPKLLSKLKIKVRDLFLRPVTCLKQSSSILEAVDAIVNKNKHSTPVVDNEGRLMGVITLTDIYPDLIGKVEKDHLKKTKTPFENIINVLDGIIYYGCYPYKSVKGEIITFSELLLEEPLKEGDILILGDVNEYKEKAIKSGATCLIIATENKSTFQMNIPSDFKGIVLVVETSVFNIIKLIEKTVPVESMIKKQMLEYFELNDTIEEVKEQIFGSKHRSFPVVNKEGVVVGLLSRSDLLRVNRKKVILVDHNEKEQSVQGIEDAEILEIIDHHRIANVQTMSPLYFRAEPVGCTSTIIKSLYDESNESIPKDIAGLMLSAILSDTLLFHSPTCTERDKKAAYELAKIAGVNIETYGMDMIIAGTAINEDETPESLITKDMKSFNLGKHKSMVSQINTGDFKSLSKMLPILKEKIEKICEDENFDVAVLMITSIIIGGTEIIVAGRNKILAQNAFNMKVDEDTIFLPGVFSRKKQIVPELMNAAQL